MGRTSRDRSAKVAATASRSTPRLGERQSQLLNVEDRDRGAALQPFEDDVPSGLVLQMGEDGRGVDGAGDRVSHRRRALPPLRPSCSTSRRRSAMNSSLRLRVAGTIDWMRARARSRACRRVVIWAPLSVTSILSCPAPSRPIARRTSAGRTMRPFSATFTTTTVMMRSPRFEPRMPYHAIVCSSCHCTEVHHHRSSRGFRTLRACRGRSQHACHQWSRNTRCAIMTPWNRSLAAARKDPGIVRKPVAQRTPRPGRDEVSRSGPHAVSHGWSVDGLARGGSTVTDDGARAVARPAPPPGDRP